MPKTILLVYAHPEPTSLTRTLADEAKATLTAEGHRVLESDLYGMGWKAVFDGDDFVSRKRTDRLSFIEESGAAFAGATQTADVAEEQAKLVAADAVIFVFPLWWFSFPAILKGWVDRVFAFGLAYGYKGAGNQYRYGEGGLAGKRALLCTSVGGPLQDYGARGINGSLEQILFPITHGTLFFAGMEVLPTVAVYSSVAMTEERMEAERARWRQRLIGLFADAAIAFRTQNGGDYPDRHCLAEDVAPKQYGITAHVRQPETFV